MTNDQEAVRAKIAKLMALAQDAGANQFEAEAAMRQAEKLMRLHAIEAADIQAATGKKPQYDWARVLVPARVPVPVTTAVTWFGSLAVAVAKFTDTAAAWKRTAEHGMCIELRGDSCDLGYAVYLQKHLRDAIRHDSNKFAGTRREREDFRRAMVGRIAERLQALKREQREAMEKVATATSNALVIITSKIALRDEFFGHKPRYTSGGNRHYDNYALGAGRAAGDKVGFGRPIGQSTTRALEH